MRELADLPCPVTLTHGDILEALDEDNSYDAIHSSFVLHHLPTERKAEFFRRAARRLAPDGLLLLVDTACEEDETLDDYLQRYCGWLRRDWTGLSAQELDAICDHIVNNDMPEPYSTLLALARAAGLRGSARRRPIRRASAGLFRAGLNERESGRSCRAGPEPRFADAWARPRR